jgi:hypothetical protein
MGVAMAQNLEYRISSMGFKVAKINLNIGKDKLYVKASNNGFRTIFPHLNNIYRVSFDQDFIPHTSVRIIHQDALKDSVTTIYSQNDATMHRKSNNERVSYKISGDTYDIFTLLAMISKKAKAVGEYNVDGNGRTWKAVVSGGKIENIKTSLGTFQTTKYELRFKAQSPQKAPYVDMLTHNFLDEDMHLSIWVNQGGVPVKAHLRKKLMVMIWEILSIS